MTPVQPIFILGFVHSGTSMLQDIFLRHGDVFVPGRETYFYEFPYLYTRRFRSLDREDSIQGMIQFSANLILKGYWSLYVLKRESFDEHVLNREEVSLIQAELPPHPEHGHVFGATFSFLARRTNKYFFVEKTPAHCFHVGKILRQLPNARIVEIVRDPRDILGSRKIRDHRVKNRLRERTAREVDLKSRGMTEYHPFWTALAWRNAVRKVGRTKEQNPKSILTIRYEDLVDHPRETILNVCAFIGLEFRESMLDVDRVNVATWEKEDSAAHTGIVRDSVGRWRQSLSRGEQALAWLLLGSDLRKHGYPDERPGAVGVAAAAGIVLGSLPALGKRIYLKLRYQGTGYTAAALRSYLGRLRRM